ncbi:MAG: GDSL-type esterase/lipase family protein [Planctomycetaceae bacterium]|jgi:lysophospholipase L1-like esterase|nr:GDSL-type esterase/lipase family protein [Planctomycetaceae bacterium]
MKTEVENTNITQSQPLNFPKQNHLKKWMLNILAVMFGLIVVCGALGILDILAQQELKKTGDALPKIILYRWKTSYRGTATPLNRIDPLNGPTCNLENMSLELVENNLPFIIANYFKIYLRQSDAAKFDNYSTPQPTIITPELLSKLERPFIVCLGGSTTDPFYKSQTNINNNKNPNINGAWAEELARLMQNQNINGTVFCGGTSGYNTSNDLLKLIRDVIEIKPDAVVSYGGYNDLVMKRDFKFYNNLQYDYYRVTQIKSAVLPRTFFLPNLIRYFAKIKEIKKEEERKKNNTFTQIELYGGIKSELNETDFMIRNWKLMNAICQSQNIKFYAILQPCVGSSEKTINNKTIIEKNWNKSYVNIDEQWRPSLKTLVKNYNDAKNKIQKNNNNFIHDFTDIFDNHNLNEIYAYDIDPCHISQKGNKIIAEKIFNIIKNNTTTNQININNNKNQKEYKE